MGATGTRNWMRVGRVIVLTMVLLGATAGTPAGADAPNMGGGTLAGTINFAAPGIPPINTPCAEVDFSFSLEGSAAIVNGEGIFFAGAIGNPADGDPQVFPSPPVTGTGHSDCENTSVGGGTLSIDEIDAENPFTGPGRIKCTAPPGKTSISGVYVRTLGDVSAVVSAQCQINTSPPDRVAFIIRGQVTPTTPGQGVTTSVVNASFVGGFVVVPAGDPIQP